jgi:hypothetical protein
MHQLPESRRRLTKRAILAPSDSSYLDFIHQPLHLFCDRWCIAASGIRGRVTSTEGAILVIEETVAASVALRAHLKRTERIGRKMIISLELGAAISEAVEAAGGHPAELRRTSQEILDNYELSRRRMREFFMLASLDEGLSIAEMARRLGVSRQLASRLVLEARKASQVSPPTAIDLR